MARPMRLIVAGVLTLLVALVLFFPARVAYQWFVPDDVQLGAISGSVWKGSAREASVSGLYLRDLSWAVRPLRLLGGTLSYAVEARIAGGFVEGFIGIGLTGTLTISKLAASLPLESFREVTNNRGLAGSLSVQVDEARIVGRVPVAGQGTFDVTDLVVPQLHQGSIGGFRGSLQSQSDSVLVTYEDTDGLVDIEGRIEIRRDGHFRHTALLQSKPATPARLRDGIGLMPLAADGSGWHEWTFGEGQL